MDLREMRYILELAKTKHMTHAANNLYISQPALYKSIRKVEKHVFEFIDMLWDNTDSLFPQ